jgi:hypothetical protein
MSKFIKYDSALTDVTSFSANFENRELSARPQFSADNTYTTLTCGFSVIKTFTGYNLDSVEYVVLSCTNNSDLFLSGHALSATYGFTHITGAANVGIGSTVPAIGLSAISVTGGTLSLSPVLSGIILSSSKYTLNNYNTMEITFPQLSGTGEVDIIAINPAGVGKFSTDIGSAITINS